MKSRVYLLYSCNEHKDSCSMNLICATTSKISLEEALKEVFIYREMKYNGKEGIYAWIEYRNHNNYDLLEYGYIEEFDDGYLYIDRNA